MAKGTSGTALANEKKLPLLIILTEEKYTKATESIVFVAVQN